LALDYIELIKCLLISILINGNGAMFQVEHCGCLVSCFVNQNNQFLASRANGNQSFPHVFEHYLTLIFRAAKLNIEEHGVSNEAWGNLITEIDLKKAEGANRAAI